MLRFWPLVLLTAGVLALTALTAMACAGEEEALEPALTGTTAATPVASTTPTPGATVTPSQSPAPGAAITGSITGPANAHPGEALTYRVMFDVPGENSAVLAIGWSDNTLQYVSWTLVAGKAAAVGEPRYLRWEIEATGAFDLVVQVPQGKLSGTFSVSAYVLGTGIGSEFQPASTTITAP